MIKPENKTRYCRLFEAVINGATPADAGAIAGVSAWRAKQVINWFTRVLVQQKYGKDYPGGRYRDLKEMRSNKSYWLARLRAFEGDTTAVR